MLQSNKNGLDFEGSVERIAIKNNYVIQRFKDNGFVKGNVLFKNVPFVNIYGSKCRTEFAIKNKGRFIRIECRSQKVGGSVDEKLPYLIENIKNCFKEKFVVVVLSLKNVKAGCEEWFKNEVSQIKHKRVLVLSLEQFEVEMKNDFNSFD